jgi:arsenate reductase
MDFVFTVCDNAAKEAWSANDRALGSAAVQGTPEEIEKAFRDAFMILERRISLFLALPLASLDKLAIKKEIDSIGEQ